MANTEPSGLLLPLAARAVAVRGDARARQRAALHVLDWLGNAALGATLPAGQSMARWLAMQAAGDVPTLAGQRADAGAAAAYHGALGSLLEMDDVHRSSVLHPGPVVVPAAWAAAWAHTGVDTAPTVLLGAVVSGVETMVRVGRALGPGHYRFWHPTSTAGAFGAAAAAATVLGLDEAHTAQALALAGTRAGGLWQVRHEANSAKAWHMAGAARDGLAAAQLAAAGMTGPLAVLEGASGWFAATAPNAVAHLIDEDRGEPWIFDLSFKPWPACRHAHPAMDALRTALAGRTVAPEDVLRIEAHGYADARRFCERTHPADTAQARFSIPHALAAMLLWGEPTLLHYEGAALADPRVATLRERVSLHDDVAIQARYPAQYGARMRLVFAGGEVLQAEVADTYGDPACPMPHEALVGKARMLMHAAGWSTARITAALEACAALPTAPDLRELAAALVPPLSPPLSPRP